MAGIDWVLIAWTVALFAVCGFLGRRYPSAKVWNWADVVYYPLAAIAVVLLFFSNDINRSLGEATAAKLRIERDLEAHPNPSPDQYFGESPVELIPETHRFLRNSVDLGKYCDEPNLEQCVVYSGIGEQFEIAFKGYKYPGPIEDQVARAEALETFCRRIDAMVSGLASDGIGAYAYDNVRRVWSELRSIEDVAQSGDDLKTALSQNRAEFVSRLKVEKDRVFAGKILDAHNQFADGLFSVAAFCALRPKSDVTRLAQIAAWKAEEGRRGERLARAQAEVDRAKSNITKSRVQSVADWVRSRAWPFLIALPLALKFGKACVQFPAPPRRGRMWPRGRKASDASTPAMDLPKRP